MLKRLLELLTNVFNPELRMKRTLEKNEVIHRSTNYAHSSGVIKGSSVNSSRNGKIQGSPLKGNTASSSSINKSSTRSDDTLTTTLLVSSAVATSSADSSHCSSSSNDSTSNTYSDTSSCDSGGF
ncbi:hypothetical protein [Lysinibacillus fusiformis]|uniref:hypothetical protein n=1 Tax=Lysinibacillus fusiformis TaxID=28031 RepID=UPI00187E2415|nr:hypothetical protein [Lysinibacillus fusiformis]MBD8523836.1 hypothetical protein [Lysinibacillus fusiformis]